MPKNVAHNTIIENTAKKLNLPLEQVEIVLEDFYKELRRYLENFEIQENRGIQIRNFLQIRVKPKRLNYEIEKGKKFGKNIEHLQRLYNKINKIEDAHTKGQEQDES